MNHPADALAFKTIEAVVIRAHASLYAEARDQIHVQQYIRNLLQKFINVKNLSVILWRGRISERDVVRELYLQEFFFGTLAGPATSLKVTMGLSTTVPAGFDLGSTLAWR